MDFTLGENVNLGERSHFITSEVSDGTSQSSLRTLSQELFTSAANLRKHCLSPDDLNVFEEANAPHKLSRTAAAFPRAETNTNVQLGSASLPMRCNSIVLNDRLGYSPPNSSASNSVPLACQFPPMGVKPSRNDSVLMAQACNGSDGIRGLPMPVLGDGPRMVNSGSPFTTEQWVEFHQHVLIFKCIAEGFTPPAPLLMQLRNTAPTLNRLPISRYSLPSNLTFNLGRRTTTDSEPGRCRRTDGKKWRCARAVVPEQKYCERHMNRGRNRSRKSSDDYHSTLSQHSGAVQTRLSSTTSADFVSAGNSKHKGINLHVGTNSSNSRSAAMGIISNQRTSSSLATKNFPTSYPHFPTSLCNQLQFPFQAFHPSAGDGGANKDLRIFSGIPKHDVACRSEHTFVSEGEVSTRLVFEAHQIPSNFDTMHETNNGFQFLSSQIKQNLASVQQNVLPHRMTSFVSLDLTATSEGKCPNSFALSTGDTVSLDICRELGGLPVRQYLVDWPWSRDAALLSWQSLKDVQISKDPSNTHLSISIPTQLDFPSSNGSSRSATATPLCLNLSATRNKSDYVVGDITHMGSVINEDAHRQPSWVPISWENSMGGPLAEVLHSSTPQGVKSPGLKLLEEDWDGSPQNSLRRTSPTGVLQKFSSYSDSSSSASSPRSTKCEQGPRENIHSPSLANATCQLLS